MKMALSPLMQQYLSIKEKYQDAIIFFRVGDFYEMFFEDAKLASAELELTLTGKDCGLEERAPMCGVPFHSYEGYAAKVQERVTRQIRDYAYDCAMEMAVLPGADRGKLDAELTSYKASCTCSTGKRADGSRRAGRLCYR